MNRLKSDTVFHRITFPLSVLLLYILDVPGIGLISLTKSSCFGSSNVELFRLDPVGILKSVCSVSSSSGFVLIGLYPFLSDGSGFSISKSLSSSISRSSLSDSESDFRVRFWIFSIFHSVCLGVFHSTECIFRRRLGDSVDFRRDFVSDLRCPFFLRFGRIFFRFVHRLFFGFGFCHNQIVCYLPFFVSRYVDWELWFFLS